LEAVEQGVTVAILVYKYSLQLILIINELELAFHSVAFCQILNGLPKKIGKNRTFFAILKKNKHH